LLTEILVARHFYPGDRPKSLDAPRRYRQVRSCLRSIGDKSRLCHLSQEKKYRGTPRIGRLRAEGIERNAVLFAEMCAEGTGVAIT
jgi:hypothetical protein